MRLRAPQASKQRRAEGSRTCDNARHGDSRDACYKIHACVSRSVVTRVDLALDADIGENARRAPRSSQWTIRARRGSGAQVIIFRSTCSPAQNNLALNRRRVVTFFRSARGESRRIDSALAPCRTSRATPSCLGPVSPARGRGTPMAGGPRNWNHAALRKNATLKLTSLASELTLTPLAM